MTPYERVKLSRERTAGVFPLPSPLDCIRYAICELAEYDDALLRLERIGDKRNNARQPDPRAELGQAFYMLLSGFVSIAEWASAPLMVEAERYGYDAAYVYFGVLSELADLARNMINEEEVDTVLYSYTSAWEGMLIICQCHGWDVAALVDDACATFEAKHAAARQVQP